MIVPEPCSEERLEELLTIASMEEHVSLDDGTYPVLVNTGMTPGELAWLVREARVAARLGAELEAVRQELWEALEVVVDQRCVSAVSAKEELALLRAFESKCLEIVELSERDDVRSSLLLGALDDLDEARGGP